MARMWWAFHASTLEYTLMDLTAGTLVDEIIPPSGLAPEEFFDQYYTDEEDYFHFEWPYRIAFKAHRIYDVDPSHLYGLTLYAVTDSYDAGAYQLLSVSLDVVQPSVPEPLTLSLLGMGTLGLLALKRRRRG